MAMTVDPVTGRKSINYISGEKVESITKRGLFRDDVYKLESQWDAEATGKTILGTSNFLSTTGNADTLAALQSSGGQNLINSNPEFAAYYKAYMQEEESRKRLGKVFGVQNTILGGTGPVGTDASKKGTILGG